MSALTPAEVLVVIPTFNEEGHIEACVEALVGDPAMAGVTVAIADGRSTDRTREIVAGLSARHPGVTLVDNPARIQSAGVNRAVEALAGPRHRVMVRCDAHSRYPAGYVMGVARLMVERDLQSVVVPMDAEGDTPFGRALAAIIDTPLGAGGSAHRGGTRSGLVDHGHHAAFDLATYCALGGYDETFRHNEDAEYDRRLTERGGRIWLAAEWRIGIVVRGTPGRLWRQYANYGRGRARMLAKHRLRPKPRQAIPALHVLALGGSAVLLPFTVLGLAYPMLYLGVVALACGWAVRRLGRAEGLWAGLALAIMHTAWGSAFLAQVVRGAGAVDGGAPLRRREGVGEPTCSAP
ncbi:MAG: glycosyltransferase family 2 protein [Pseudomonadota bacterium]